MVAADGSKSINGTLHKMKTINKSTFSIEDTTMFSTYVRNGTAKLVKTPITLQFKPIHELLVEPQPELDLNMSQSDFMKLDNPLLTHVAYEALSTLYPRQLHIEELNKFIDIFQSVASRYISKDDLTSKEEQIRTFALQFGFSVSAGSFAPLSAFFGGFVSQEIIKCLTNKFIPVKQIYYTDCVEVLATIPGDQEQLKVHIETINEQIS